MFCTCDCDGSQHFYYPVVIRNFLSPKQDTPLFLFPLEMGMRGGREETLTRAHSVHHCLMKKETVSCVSAAWFLTGSSLWSIPFSAVHLSGWVIFLILTMRSPPFTYFKLTTIKGFVQISTLYLIWIKNSEIYFPLIFITSFPNKSNKPSKAAFSNK